MEVLQDGVLAFLPPIVICDCGLDEAGLSRARELTQRYDNVLLLAPEEIIQNLP